MAQVKTKPKPAGEPAQAAAGESVPALPPARLPYHPAIKERFGVDRAEWKALCEAIFPLATSTDAIVLALSYCRARSLDPFKRVVHIVPIWSKEKGALVDTVWPGIAELRTTAFRTGLYAGRDETKFGPTMEAKVGSIVVEFPEWAQITVYRMVAGTRCAFPGPRVYWLETYARKARNDESPNEMWARRSFGQLDKCAEAAALRGAFPEELGGENTNDEIESEGGDLRPDSDGVYVPAAKGEPRPERAPEPKPRPAPVQVDPGPEPEPEQGPPAVDSSDPGPVDPRAAEPAPVAAALPAGAIPLKGADYKEWGAAFKRALGACGDDAAVTALLNANAGTLARIEKADSVRHESLIEAVQDRRDHLADDNRG